MHLIMSFGRGNYAHLCVYVYGDCVCVYVYFYVQVLLVPVWIFSKEIYF